MTICEIFFSQIIALIAFFAFPAIQYFALKILVGKEGRPELWYLPDYGFRLVIRNLPRKKTLTNINYKVYVRRTVPPSPGASVETYDDQTLVEANSFVIFPDTDQVLLSFKLERNEKTKELYFVYTDKLGNEKRRISIDNIMLLISDYTANVENWFNFDVKLAKQVCIDSDYLKRIHEETQLNNCEQLFSLINVRNIE